MIERKDWLRKQQLPQLPSSQKLTSATCSEYPSKVWKNTVGKNTAWNYTVWKNIFLHLPEEKWIEPGVNQSVPEMFLTPLFFTCFLCVKNFVSCILLIFLIFLYFLCFRHLLLSHTHLRCRGIAAMVGSRRCCGGS